MLEQCNKDEFVCDNNPPWDLPYAVTDSQVEIIDDMSARLTAVLNGPPGSTVQGLGWLSDEDGTLVDNMTGEMPAGTRTSIDLTIPHKREQNGNLNACIRLVSPEEGTKHVIMWTLREGDIIHPPQSKPCED